MLQKTDNPSNPTQAGQGLRRILLMTCAIFCVALTTMAAVGASEGEPVSAGVIESNSEELLMPLAAVETVDAIGLPGHVDGLLIANAPAHLPRLLWMEVTAYCACKKCCGPDAQGLTASGKRVNYNDGRFVAADTGVLPFGTKLSIPGYHQGDVVEVIDRGGAIKGQKLDLYFPTHEAALDWGRQWVAVTVY